MGVPTKAAAACLAIALFVVLWTGGAGAQQSCYAALPGERISLDLRGADLQTTLRLLAHQYRVNLIVPEDVKGSITLSLFEVPVRDVFRTMIDSGGLQCVEREGVLRVGKGDAKALTPFELKGIMSFPGGHVAIVNNQPVKVGDVVSDHRVESITDTEVVLRQPDGSPRTVTLATVASPAPRR